ncbi:MAG: cell division protein FtsX [Sphingomonadales bacterium]
MSEEEAIKTKKRRPSALPGISSLALVMFMLGLLSLTYLGFQGLSKSLVESSSLDIYFKDSCTEDQVKALENELKKEKWYKSSRFISREEGMKEMAASNDSAFMQYVELNALPLSLELYFKAEFASAAQLESISGRLQKLQIIESVIYQKNLLETVNSNVAKIQLTLLGLTLIFVVIAIGLIHNSTRLNIFANRFIIKSMQLVGATHGFIIRPIIGKFIGYACIAFPISLVMLFGAFRGINYIWSGFGSISEITAFIAPSQAAFCMAGTLLCGILIAAGSAWFSTRKYLRSKIENLY